MTFFNIVIFAVFTSFIALVNGQASCSSPPSVSNSYVLSQSPYNNGTSVAYGCNAQYTPSGATSLLCYNGLWLGTIPVCVPINTTNDIYNLPTWLLIIVVVLVLLFVFLLLTLLIWFCCYYMGCCDSCYLCCCGGGGCFGKGKKSSDGNGGTIENRHLHGRRRRGRMLHVTPAPYYDDGYYSYGPRGRPYNRDYSDLDYGHYNSRSNAAQITDDDDTKNACMQVYYIDGYLRPNKVDTVSIQAGPNQQSAEDRDKGTSTVPNGQVTGHGYVSTGKGSNTAAMINVTPTNSRENQRHWAKVNNQMRSSTSPNHNKPKDDKFSTVVDKLLEEEKIRKTAKDPRLNQPMWMPHANPVRGINTSTK